MTNDPAGGARSSVVLVALSSKQREELGSELAQLARPGIEMVFEEAEGVALDLVTKRDPALVIVGMTIGMMDGLEFVAVLFKKNPGFRGKVVVLPDKGDPFPPVMQWRDPSSGKSSTEPTDLSTLQKLVAALAPAPAAPKPEPLAAPIAAKQAPVPVKEQPPKPVQEKSTPKTAGQRAPIDAVGQSAGVLPARPPIARATPAAQVSGANTWPAAKTRSAEAATDAVGQSAGVLPARPPIDAVGQSAGVLPARPPTAAPAPAPPRAARPSEATRFVTPDGVRDRSETTARAAPPRAGSIPRPAVQPRARAPVDDGSRNHSAASTANVAPAPDAPAPAHDAPASDTPASDIPDEPAPDAPAPAPHAPSPTAPDTPSPVESSAMELGPAHVAAAVMYAAPVGAPRIARGPFRLPQAAVIALVAVAALGVVGGVVALVGRGAAAPGDSPSQHASDGGKTNDAR